jgi:NAD(P)-dependent dehydrogenase (short-subunit alcohol dehydrogenase family)
MRDSFETNTVGVANTVEAFLLLLHESDQPRIVMMSSGAGSLARKADAVSTYTTTKYVAPAYDCSKAALNMLMLHYKNVLPGKFKVNSCCPGFRVSVHQFV